MSSHCVDYINDELFNKFHSVTFTDLMNKFHIGSSQAKQIMYKYYKDTTTMKFNCIIVMCHKDGTVKVVTDLNGQAAQNNDDILDCFIYAFNPNNEFIPINDLKDETGSNLITNPYKLNIKPGDISSVTASQQKKNVPVKRAQTLGGNVGSSDGTDSNNNNNKISNSVRSKTLPVMKSTTETKPKKKSTGLKSTEILAKMRRAREEKELERQRELKQRKEQEQQRLNKDPKRRAQMDDLNKLFVDDEEEENDADLMDIDKEEEEARNKPKQTIDDNELENLLDTTAEESLMEIKKRNEDIEMNSEPDISNVVDGSDGATKNNKNNNNNNNDQKQGLGDESIEEITTSYVDKDGYIVTKRQTPPSQTKTQTPKNRSNSSLSRLSALSKRSTGKALSSSSPPKKKIKQGSIESFFKRS